jgi:multidrug resistance efflux pump
LLVDLDPRDFEVNRAIAAASLASARSKVVEAQAQQKTTRPAASPTSFETRVEVLA